PVGFVARVASSSFVCQRCGASIRSVVLLRLRGCDRHRAADRIYAGRDAISWALRIANGDITWVGSGPGDIIKHCCCNRRAALLNRKTIERDELLLITWRRSAVVGGCRIWRHRDPYRPTVTSTTTTECRDEN